MHWAVERILVGRADRQTIAKYATGADRYLGLAVMIAAALLGLALTQPLIAANGFAGLQGSYSLLTIMNEYFANGRMALALLMAALVILLPVLLLSLAFDLWYKHEPGNDRFLRKATLLRHLSRGLLLILILALIGFFIAGRETGVSLHFASGYLAFSLALQNLIAARMLTYIDAVRFVEEEGN